MDKKLVIVESPAKARTINKILGAGFVVRASMGHVRDLPERRLGVDVEHGFRPDYVTVKGREKIVGELRAAAKGVSEIYLAPDPDREGEAIAWHLKALLGGAVPDDRFRRVTYNEITAPAIREAFARPGEIDQRKVDSQQARRVLDRLVGYRVSPLLWRRVRGGMSAGRVQSVALRLVCEREKAILDFVPKEYWIVGAIVAKQVAPRDPFAVRLVRIGGEKAEIADAARAEAVRADLDDRPMAVRAIRTREIRRRAPPPFITSTLQQAASRLCGYSPSRTMRIAQTLYEGVDFGGGPVGLITYMRTDSVNVSRQAQEAARAFVRERFGADYVPDAPNVYRSRDSAQEAHEAIRPTDVSRTPDEMASRLKPDELKLYRVIWERFVASQMAAAVIRQRSVEVEAVPPRPEATAYLFRASTSEVAFPGYLRAMGGAAAPRPAGEEASEEEGGEEVDRLPPLAEGEALDRKEWTAEQKFTPPPPRYSEATLIRALEEFGIGRPSTYAQTLSVLDRRRYVEKEKRTLKPTDLGLAVNEFLVAHLDALFNVQFTARMEESLDEIEKGTVEWTSMLRDFHEKLSGWLKVSRGPDGNVDVAARLLKRLEDVKEWGPETTRGKRAYGDRPFVESVRRQLEQGRRTLTERQVDALKRVASRYRSQVPALDAEAAELGLPEAADPSAASAAGPDEATREKLARLGGVKFEPPRQVGDRTFNDREFFESLRQQAESGRALSPKQLRYVDRLLAKYRAQIPDYESFAERVGLGAAAGAGAGDAGGEPAREECAGLIARMRRVTAWKEPVKRGRREWNDRTFFESLARQFGERKSLSERQLAALRKMANRYREQAGEDPAGNTPPGDAAAPGPVS